MAQNTINDKRGWHFTIVENFILEDERLDNYDRMSYIALCYYSNTTTKECFPSQKALMDIAGCSRSRLKKSLRRLEKAGYIDIKRRKEEGRNNKTNIYTLKGVGSSENPGGVVRKPRGGREKPTELDPQELDPLNYNTEKKNKGYSKEVKNIVKYLRTKLKSKGIDNFPKMWPMKNMAVANSLLQNMSYDDLKKKIDIAINDKDWQVRHMKSVENYIFYKDTSDKKDGGGSRYKSYDQLKKEGKI